LQHFRQHGGLTGGSGAEIGPRADDSPGTHGYPGAVTALKSAIAAVWVAFWVYWLLSAVGAKRGSRSLRTRPPGLLIIIFGVVLIRIIGASSLAVDNPALEAVGVILLLSGLGLAVWARIFLGRNWGMPMTHKDEPELVTSGPYRLVRHPIYSGILLAILGTSLATNLYLLIAVAVIGVYFIYSAKVEEKIMTTSFPNSYPSYRMRTKMLIPFVL
jgi:protein-S-isoprenylcysteine O-methyltransferase Ste14